ncbi:hypothetical protein BJX96DRAFT_155741 [Aspergillus floccosus]
MPHNRITRTAHAVTHEKSFKEAINSIHQAVRRALPSKHRYDCVRVLTMRWDNDDLGLKDIETELLELFRGRFNYATDSLLIPSTSARDAQTALRLKMTTLSKYNSPKTLFIVIYEGHATTLRGPSDSCPLHIFGSRETNISIPWLFVESEFLPIADSDIFVMLDTCFATNAVVGSSGARNEYLAAAASESEATDAMETSLTRRFIDLLRDMEELEITVAQIHSLLVQRSNRPESRLAFTPVHIAASQKPSVTLRPLQYIPKEVVSPPKTKESADGKVLVSVLLEGKTSIPDVEQWTKWLITSVPENIADIKIETVFKSNSSLCLMTMPIEVYDMIRGNDAFSFVAFVESNNILIRQRPAPRDHGILASRAGNVELPHREKE